MAEANAILNLGQNTSGHDTADETPTTVPLRGSFTNSSTGNPGAYRTLVWNTMLTRHARMKINVSIRTSTPTPTYPFHGITGARAGSFCQISRARFTQARRCLKREASRERLRELSLALQSALTYSSVWYIRLCCPYIFGPNSIALLQLIVLCLVFPIVLALKRWYVCVHMYVAPNVTVHTNLCLKDDTPIRRLALKIRVKPLLACVLSSISVCFFLSQLVR